MSEENLEIVRRGFTAWSGGDATALIQGLDPDVVLHVDQAGQGVYRGREGAIKSLANDLSVAQDPDVRGVGCGLDSAFPADTGEQNGNDDIISADDELLRFEAHRRPVLSDQGRELPDSLVSVVHAGIEGAARNVVHNLRVQEA